MRSAIQINVWKTGMKILADYKRRKDLKQYLPHSEHWKLKNDRKSLNKSAANLAAGESPATKRSISTSEDAEPADGEPPVKRVATGEGEEKEGEPGGVESLGVGELAADEAAAADAETAGAE